MAVMLEDGKVTSWDSPLFSEINTICIPQMEQ
jgi:hypothetical protein